MSSEEAKLANLRCHVKSTNWVYCCGYTEATHRGALIHLLRSEHRNQVVSRLWSRAPTTQEIRAGEIGCRSVVTQREVSLARGVRADLVIKFSTDEGQRAILCEFKVDDVKGEMDEQLRRLECSWRSKHCGLNSAFVVFALGGAEFWQSRPWQCCGSFVQVGVQEMLGLLPPDPRSKLLAEYEKALKDEIVRRKIAATSLSKEEKCGLGYRGRDLWYALYNKVREAMDPSYAKQWRIYTGGNNAAFNWWPSYSQPADVARTASGAFYVELNNGQLCFKFHWCGAEGTRENVKCLKTAALNVLPDGWSATQTRLKKRPQKFTTLAKQPFGLSDPEGAAKRLQELVSTKFPTLCAQIRRKAFV